MASIGELRRRWDRAFVQAARERGLRTVGGAGFAVDGVHLTEVCLVANRARQGGLRAWWWVATKPLALDDVLWDAFMPDLDAGPVKRRNLRVNGCFRAPALDLARAAPVVPEDTDPAPLVTTALDAFSRERDAYLAVAPTAADFLAQVRARTDGPPSRPRELLLEALALVVAGERTEAVTLLEGAVARDEVPPMSSSDGGIFEVLLRRLRGTDAQ